MTYLTVECKGLMNPGNKPMSQKPYVTNICKGLMNPSNLPSKSDTKKNKKLSLSN